MARFYAVHSSNPDHFKIFNVPMGTAAVSLLHPLLILQDEKARLQTQFNQAAAGGSASEARLVEMSSTIDQLKGEGEALAKKAGEQEAALRKVRTAVTGREWSRHGAA